MLRISQALDENLNSLFFYFTNLRHSRNNEKTTLIPVYIVLVIIYPNKQRKTCHKQFATFILGFNINRALIQISEIRII